MKSKIVKLLMAGIAMGALSSCGVVVVSEGEVGLLRTWGKISDKTPTGAGMKMYNAFTSDLIKVNIKQQQQVLSCEAASADLQKVKVDFAVLYSIKADRVYDLVTTVGENQNYFSTIMASPTLEVLKSEVGKIKAEVLAGNREVVSAAIRKSLESKFQEKGFYLLEFSIVDIDFSTQFKEAIERKGVEEQNAKTAEHKLKAVEFQSQEAVKRAEAEAQAIELQSKAIAENKQILLFRALEVWDGALPQVVGGDIKPLLQILGERKKAESQEVKQ